MPYRGPTILPETPGADAWQGIEKGMMLAQELRRQRTEDEYRHRTEDLDYYGKGGRTGTAPVESPETITIPDVPTFGAPDPAALAGVLRGRPLAGPFGDGGLHGTPPFVAPSPEALARGLASGGPMVEENGITGVPPTGGGTFGDGSDMRGPDTFRAPADLGLGQQGDVASARNRAQTHPGAFDPATRSFGGSPLQQAIAQQHAGGGSGIASPGRTVTLANSTPRYVQLDEGHYVDTFHTPDAERDRDREAQARLAAELRGYDITARGQQALTLEEQRQQGRLEVRDRINNSHLAEILARGDVTAQNQATHDARLDRRSAAHDARVGTGAGAGGRPMTVGQRETNARMAADGVIAASNGSYEQAVDWLTNTPEGQEAQRAGLEPRHLYAAMGKFHNLLTTQAIGLEKGGAMYTPDEATTAVQQTRGSVRGGRFADVHGGSSSSASGSHNESVMSDADLWEQKVREGMPKDQATAYVKRRKKTP